MPYAALVVAFVLVAVLLGSWSGSQRPWLAAVLAAAIVAAQFALLMST